MMKNQLAEAQRALETCQAARGSQFYPHFHLAPPAGWMNDPNGLVYHRGVYHAFYQHHPFSEHWGPMHWGHATSEDMVHWTTQPIALAPSEDFDADGCFSGSAVDDNGVLSLIYTGHVWINGPGDDSAIRQVQCLATSQDGIHFEKQGIVLTPPPGIMHFRDPKVWHEKGQWWMVVGARDEHDCGKVLLYRGNSLREWQLDRILAEASPEMGYMWECPDFFALGKEHVLACSPQGIAANGWHNRNLFQCGFIRGTWQPGEEFTITHPFQEMDNGHDFYAVQSFLAADGRRVAVGWMDMWESPMPTKQEGWSGLLTLPRELRIDAQGQLRQTPIVELHSLRAGGQDIAKQSLTDRPLTIAEQADSLELEISFDAKASTAERYGIQLGEACSLYVDRSENRLILARHSSDTGLNSERGILLPQGDILALRIFIDRSSIEVFVNDGEACFTSRVYPEANKRQLTLFAERGSAVCLGGKLWTLKPL